jgi:iron(III) transport system permease protein
MRPALRRDLDKAPRRRWVGAAGTWLLGLVCLSALVVVPIATIAVSSLADDDGWTMANFANLATDRALREATANTLLVACGVSLLSVVVGAPLAYGVVRTPMRGKAVVQVTAVISLVSPDFLLAMAYIALAGPNAGFLNVAIRQALGWGDAAGPLNVFSLGGLVLTALPHGVAFVYLALVPALRNMDPALEEAARVQGATLFHVICGVTAPLLRPALLSGTLMAFCSSLAMYGPPQMLRMNVLTVAIRQDMLQLDFGGASASSLLLVGISVLALVLYRRSTRQADRFRTMGGKSFGSRPLSVGGWQHALTGFGALYCLLALVLPYGTMLAISMMRSVGVGFAAGNWTLANYTTIFANPAVLDAARLSVTLAAATATVVTALGLFIGLLLVRGVPIGRAPLDYLSVLPLAVPGTALAIALVIIFLNPPLNALGFYGSAGILFVAYIIRFITLGVRSSQAALLQTAPELEEAARVAGAGVLRTVVSITVPVLRHSLLYTWLLVFILTLPELSASVILKGVNTQTVSTVLLDVWNGNGGLASACALGMTIFGATAILLAAASFAGRRSGAAAMA